LTRRWDFSIIIQDGGICPKGVGFRMMGEQGLELDE